MAKDDQQDTTSNLCQPRRELEDMTSHGQRGGVSTDYVHVTHAAMSSGRIGNTSMETHVNAVAAMHDHAPWMTFESSPIQQPCTERRKTTV